MSHLPCKQKAQPTITMRELSAILDRVDVELLPLAEARRIWLELNKVFK